MLASMNRKHSADEYRGIIDRLRTARPDLVLSSDFIVGHPGKRDRDFADTLRLINDIGFTQAYSFKYSPRPGTPAAAALDQVPEAIKSERLAGLQQLLNAQQLAFNHAAEAQPKPCCLSVPATKTVNWLAAARTCNQSIAPDRKV